MRELSVDRGFRGACFVVLVASLVGLILVVPSPTRAADAIQITKVLVADNDVREISNTGTLNAVNRVFSHSSMPDDAKTQAITAILTGAMASGSLGPSTLVAGDWFFALDPVSGALIAIQFRTTEFALPNGTTSFTSLHIPIG